MPSEPTSSVHSPKPSPLLRGQRPRTLVPPECILYPNQVTIRLRLGVIVLFGQVVLPAPRRKPLSLRRRRARKIPGDLRVRDVLAHPGERVAQGRRRRRPERRGAAAQRVEPCLRAGAGDCEPVGVVVQGEGRGGG